MNAIELERRISAVARINAWANQAQEAITEAQGHLQYAEVLRELHLLNNRWEDAQLETPILEIATLLVEMRKPWAQLLIERPIIEGAEELATVLEHTLHGARLTTTIQAYLHQVKEWRNLLDSLLKEQGSLLPIPMQEEVLPKSLT